MSVIATGYPETSWAQGKVRIWRSGRVQNCKNPDSEEGKGIRVYFQTLGRNYTDEEIATKTKHLRSLHDDFVEANPDFTLDRDMMPDGVHAKPRKNWFKVSGHSKENKAAKKSKTEAHLQALRDEYAAITGDKPDYLQWAAEKSRVELFEELYRQVKGDKDRSVRGRAISTILEFTKNKPKHAIEFISSELSGEIPELFRQLSKLAGVPTEAIEAFAGTYLDPKPKTDEPVRVN